MVQIRDMTRADLDAVGAATEGGGFGNRRGFFEIAIDLGGLPVVAIEDGRIVGTGNGAIHGSVGWVGVIFVSPERRNRGIGRALSEAVCARLEAAGCSSLVLVATEMGEPVYAKLGFRVQSQYHMLSGEPLAGMPAVPSGASLQRVAPADVDGIAALDRRATGEDRRALIDRYAGSGWVLGNADGDGPSAEPRGFILPTARGNAAIVAADPGDAVCLLDLHRHLQPPEGRAWAGLLTEHEAGRQLLVDRGWYAWRTFARMVRGPDPECDPRMIWGQFNHAMG